MQAVIVAAGMASRLFPLTKSLPKCLLEVNGEPILYHLIQNLKKFNIVDIALVLGFHGNQIEVYLKNNFPEMSFHFVYNHEYETTNNAYSLLLAKNFVKEEFVLVDSDVVFEPKVLKMLLNYPKKPVLALVKCADEEAMKVEVNSDDIVQNISKNISLAMSAGESVGIEIFDFDSAKKLFKILEERIINKKNVMEFYEASFQEMIETGTYFHTVTVKKNQAMEVDFAEDLQKARDLFYKNENESLN